MRKVSSVREADISYESFMKNLKTFNKDKFSISKELVGIFNDYTKAFESIVSNAGGVDDGGCYPFAYILEVPLNYVYSIYTNSEILAYFVYLEDKETFISFDDVELLKTLSEELKEKMDFMKHYLNNI